MIKAAAINYYFLRAQAAGWGFDGCRKQARAEWWRVRKAGLDDMREVGVEAIRGLAAMAGGGDARRITGQFTNRPNLSLRETRQPEGLGG